MRDRQLTGHAESASRAARLRDLIPGGSSMGEAQAKGSPRLCRRRPPSSQPIRRAVGSYEFEREPFFLLRSVVVDTTKELVRESPAWSDRRDELLALAVDSDDAGEASPDEAAQLRIALRRHPL